MRARRLLGILLLLLLAASAGFLLFSMHRARSIRAEARALAAGGGATVRSVPERWIAWLLQVEDPAFRTHAGIDMRTPGAGWTTLTQALVKIHVPGPSRGLIGKPLQTLHALVLDAMVGKEDQLTLVLNTAYFGEGAAGPVIGFPAAARAIYGRPLPDLSDAEYLGLVAMLVGPNQFHPVRGAEAHAERLGRVRALVGGRCEPAGWDDVYLEGCAAAAAPSR